MTGKHTKNLIQLFGMVGKQTTELQKSDEDDGQRGSQENRCVNCGGDHPATERNCPERRRFQMIAREKDYAGIEGGTIIKKRKQLKKRETVPSKPTTNETGGDGINPSPPGHNENAREGKRNPNSSMSLENLLNHGAREREDQMEVVVEEDTEERTPGNVPTI